MWVLRSLGRGIRQVRFFPQLLGASNSNAPAVSNSIRSISFTSSIFRLSQPITPQRHGCFSNPSSILPHLKFPTAYKSTQAKSNKARGRCKTAKLKAMLKAKQRRLRRGKSGGPPAKKATFKRLELIQKK